MAIVQNGEDHPPLNHTWISQDQSIAQDATPVMQVETPQTQTQDQISTQASITQHTQHTLEKDMTITSQRLDDGIYRA